MLYDVKILDAKGKIKKVINGRELTRQLLESALDPEEPISDDGEKRKKGSKKSSKTT